MVRAADFPPIWAVAIRERMWQMTTECLVAEYGVDTACRGEVRHIGEIVPLVLARYLSSASRSGPDIELAEVELQEGKQSATRHVGIVGVNLTQRRKGAKNQRIFVDVGGRRG